MIVFPESMNKLDPADMQGSLRVIEQYIRYMTERVEFANRGTTGGGGAVSDEVLQKMLEMTSALSAMRSALNDLDELIDTDGNSIVFTKDLNINCGVWPG